MEKAGKTTVSCVFFIQIQNILLISFCIIPNNFLIRLFLSELIHNWQLITVNVKFLCHNLSGIEYLIVVLGNRTQKWQRGNTKFIFGAIFYIFGHCVLTFSYTFKVSFHIYNDIMIIWI